MSSMTSQMGQLLKLTCGDIMALILITIMDLDDAAVVNLVCEPTLESTDGPMTPAQRVAINMLAAVGSQPKEPEKDNVIQLLS